MDIPLTSQILANRFVRPPRPQDIQALVDQDSINPRKELVPRVVRVEMFVGPDERRLSRIAGIVGRAQHP